MYSLAARTDSRSTVPASSRTHGVSLCDLFREQPTETLAAGSAAFWEGDAATHVFEVVEGVMRVFKVLADGRRVITGFMYPGDLMGVSVSDAYLYTAEAVTKVRIRRFSRTRFEDEIARSPELRPQLFARLCDEMAAAQDQMVLLARKTAEERVSTHIIRMAQRHSGAAGQGARLEVPMTRADMADYLGLTLETVSRIMSRLISRGVISPVGRHAFEIRKWAMLTSLAGEEEEARPARIASPALN